VTLKILNQTFANRDLTNPDFGPLCLALKLSPTTSTRNASTAV